MINLDFEESIKQTIPQKEYDRCLRCGRKLKSEENRQRGYGKICFEKLQANQTNRLFTIK